ncbi:MAG: nuclear transport factor 2 family protein [Microcoleaceae cyanobacterium]
MSLVVSKVLLIVGVILCSSLVSAAIQLLTRHYNNSANGAKLANSRRIEQIHSLIDQIAETWRKGDAKEFAEMFTPDGELIISGCHWFGREAIEQVISEFVEIHPYLQVDIRHIIIEADRAVVEWHLDNVEGFVGRVDPINDDIVVIDFIGDKVRRWREYVDQDLPLRSESV